jgi:hypothetical protein
MIGLIAIHVLSLFLCLIDKRSDSVHADSGAYQVQVFPIPRLCLMGTKDLVLKPCPILQQENEQYDLITGDPPAEQIAQPHIIR